MIFYKVEIKPLTPLNVRIGTEIFVLTQFIYNHLTNNMEQMYQSEIYRNCQADKYQLTLNMAILRENPHITTLLGMYNRIFCIG